MKNRGIAVALGVLLLGLSAAGARAEASKDEDKGEKAEMADRADKADKGEKGRGRENAFKGLGLSDEQKAKLKEHRKAHREKAKELREGLRESSKALREELIKPQLDEKAVRKAHQRMKEAGAKLADHRLDGILAVRKILTPEQYQKMTERKHRRRGRFGRWFGGRGDGDRDDHKD